MLLSLLRDLLLVTIYPICVLKSPGPPAACRMQHPSSQQKMLRFPVGTPTTTFSHTFSSHTHNVTGSSVLNIPSLSQHCGLSTLWTTRQLPKAHSYCFVLANEVAVRLLRTLLTSPTSFIALSYRRLPFLTH